MGKTKQAKEKKFDRNVEISAPILDPEIIKAIHTPPRGQRLDIKHGGFKALLSDLNSQDSTDELMPLNDNHVPSYIGISCAVSGYSNYSSYNRSSASPSSHQTNKLKTCPDATETPNRSRTASPVARQSKSEVHHITIDKRNIHNVDEERKELTEKLTASATERRRSPSPITPTEDDRHHGAYVGARYCPLPPPDKLVNKHIPLLGIDDDKNPEEMVEDENKVEQKIASLYGENFVEDWRESMTHKVKKDQLPSSNADQEEPTKTPKDLVTLKPAPASEFSHEHEAAANVPTPNVKKVLAGVEKEFLNKLLTDENPPMPSQSPVHMKRSPEHQSVGSPTPPPMSPVQKLVGNVAEHDIAPSQPSPVEELLQQQQPKSPAPPSPQPLMSDSPASKSPEPQPMSPDSGKSQSFAEEELILSSSQAGKEEHIEYEIRAQSPLDNESSPVRVIHNREDSNSAEVSGEYNEQMHIDSVSGQEKLVIDFTSGELEVGLSQESQLMRFEESKREVVVDPIETMVNDEVCAKAEPLKISSDNDGQYYLSLLEEQKSFMREQIDRADLILVEKEAELDEDTVGKIRSAMGKANLLINKKCKQFEQLCEENINNNSETKQFATLNEDLAGFWDMLNIQINDIKKSFGALWELEQHGWRSTKQSSINLMDDETATMVERDESGCSLTTKISATTAKPKLSAQKDQERRERLQEHINQMKQNQASKVCSENLLGGDSESSAIEICNNDLVSVGSQGNEEAGGSGNAASKLEPEEEGKQNEDDEQLVSFIG